VAPLNPVLVDGSVLTTGCHDYLHTFRMGRGAEFALHRHDAAQLFWSTDGLARVSCSARATVVAPGRGAWVPAEADHAVVALGPATLNTLYLHDLRLAPALDELTAVAVDDLLGSVLRRLTSGDLSDDERVHLELVLFDCVARHAPIAEALVMPRDDRAVHVAASLLRHPADPRTLAELARVAGASARTLTRIFVSETGLSFEQWRRQARMHVAAGILGSGASIDLCARRVGYRSPSAFAAAYRETFGRAPSADRAR
jgi:AraC-like DNA-binding protein